MGVVVHDLGPDAGDAWVARGHRSRHFFPHRVVRLRKGGIDGLKLGRRMVGDHVVPGDLRQLILHALPPYAEDLPAEIFFDDDLVWHRQQFGLPAHVATASLVVDGRDVYVPTIVSDLAQRISRRRDLKTRVESRFKGWARLAVHAALDAARDLGAGRVLVATADLAHAHTDPGRTVQRPLFDRVYDAAVTAPFRAERDGDWWVMEVAENADRLVSPVVGDLPLPSDPPVCVHHDIERGWGHLDVDAELADRAERDGPSHLDRMVAIESDVGLAATYSIVAILLDEILPTVRGRGHAVAFHSFDHAEADEPGADDQLRRCRHVDYRLKGYRPARSRLGPELTVEALAFHNFEWLASSCHSLGHRSPVLDRGVTRLPIITDDFSLYQGRDFDEWRSDLLADIRATQAEGNPAIFSLHDCYADHWLDHYPALLDRLADLGRFATLDDVAAEVLLADSW